MRGFLPQSYGERGRILFVTSGMEPSFLKPTVTLSISVTSNIAFRWKLITSYAPKYAEEFEQ